MMPRDMTPDGERRASPCPPLPAYTEDIAFAENAAFHRIADEASALSENMDAHSFDRVVHDALGELVATIAGIAYRQGRKDAPRATTGEDLHALHRSIQKRLADVPDDELEDAMTPPRDPAPPDAARDDDAALFREADRWHEIDIVDMDHAPDPCDHLVCRLAARLRAVREERDALSDLATRTKDERDASRRAYVELDVLCKVSLSENESAALVIAEQDARIATLREQVRRDHARCMRADGSPCGDDSYDSEPHLITQGWESAGPHCRLCYDRHASDCVPDENMDPHPQTHRETWGYPCATLRACGIEPEETT